MKIGVCDVNPAETARTVFLLNSQLRNLKENSRNTERNLKNKAGHDSEGLEDYLQNKHIDCDNVTIISYNLDLVMLDLDDQKFDCDIFISELSFSGGKNGVKLARKINDSAP